MSAVNNCCFVGRVYSDKIDVDSFGDRARAKFTITVRRGQGKADFIPVTAWGSQAEFAEKYLEKGKSVAIRGEFHSNRVEGSDGVKWFYGIDAYEINFLPGNEGDEGQTERRASGRGNGGGGRKYPSTPIHDVDDEAPF